MAFSFRCILLNSLGRDQALQLDQARQQYGGRMVHCFILFHVSTTFPSLSIQVTDANSQFLLIEAAYTLAYLLNAETATNRIFICADNLHILPKNRFFSSPPLLQALSTTTDGKAIHMLLRKCTQRFSDRSRSTHEWAMWKVHWVVARFLVVCGTRSIVLAVLDLSGGGVFLWLDCGLD